MVSNNKLARFGLFILVALASGALSACSQTQAAPTAATGAVVMAPMDDMPAEVKTSAATVQQAYSFAVGNPEIVKRLPCYCGCGAMGHQSLYACYVSSVEPGGKITFDTHALGCSICVDIAQDALRLTQEGQSVDQIRAYVDETYAKYGTSNLP